MRSVGVGLSALSLTLLLGASASAQTSECARAVVITLPAVTWELIAEVRPPNIL